MSKNNLKSFKKMSAIGFSTAFAILGLAACGGNQSGTAGAQPNVYMAQLAPLNDLQAAPIGVAEVVRNNNRLEVHVTANADATQAMQVVRIHGGSCDAVTSNMEANVTDPTMANAITVALDDSSAASGEVNGAVSLPDNQAANLGQDIIVVHSVVNGNATPIACGHLQLGTSPSPSPSPSASASPSPSPSASASQGQSQSQSQAQVPVQSKTTTVQSKTQSKSSSQGQTQSKTTSQSQTQSKSTSQSKTSGTQSQGSNGQSGS